MSLYTEVLNEDGSFNYKGIAAIAIYLQHTKNYSIEHANKEAIAYADLRQACRYPHMYKGEWVEVQDPIDTVGTRD